MNIYTKEDIESHVAKHGRLPLIIGREYVFLDQWVKLVKASTQHSEATIETRSGEMATCDLDELSWKYDRVPTPTPITAEGLRGVGGWKESSEDFGFFFQHYTPEGHNEREMTVDTIPGSTDWTFEVNGVVLCTVTSMEQLASLVAAIRGPGE